MKKAIAWIVALALIAGVLFTATRALAQEAAAAQVPSIDAVILLDHSNSMSKSAYTMNDPLGYRFDATEMFISMCDLNGSRVAVIPFAGNIFDYDGGFVDISDRSVRESKLAALEQMYRDNRTQAHTDYGIALSAAVKTILDRTDTANKPMIILLTDGELEIGETTGAKNIYEWNAAEETFDIVQTKSYTLADAKQQADTAVAVAAEYGIPIYTIALLEDIPNNSADRAGMEIEQNQFKTILNDYALQTHGFFTPISASNVYELPVKFGEIFAEQINSTLLNDLTPKRTGDNEYEVLIPVLNQSVQEANIFIPSRELIGVHLYNANDQEVTSGSGDVYLFSGKSFQLYKIFHPQSTGSWRLTFSLPDGDGDTSQIAFSLLYNYNITLKSTVSAGAAAYDTQPLTCGKNDTLHIQTRFYNLDGTPSGDLDLYTVYDSSADPDTAWWTIRGEISLVDSAGKILYTGAMDNGYDSFTGTLNLTTAATDAQGFSTLSSGGYTLRIKAEGAGLRRTEDIPITLTNANPYLADGSGAIRRLLTVDDPDNAETQDVQTFLIDLYTEITDPDNDRLSFTLSPANDAATSLVLLTLDTLNGTITGQTVKNPETGMFNSGTAEYVLGVRDGDQNAVLQEFPIVIDVESIAEQMIRGLTCDTTVTGWDGNRVAPKNSPLTFTMTLSSDPASAAPIDPAGQIGNFTGAVKIIDSNSNKLLQAVPMTLTGDALTATVETGSTSGAFTAVCTYIYSTYAGQSETQTFPFTIGNRAPDVSAAALAAVPDTITFHPLPGILRLLEQPTGTQDLQIDLARLIPDPDNETPAYAQPEIQNEDANNYETLLTYGQEGDTLTLIPQGAGKVTLAVTATDGDGETATAVKTITLVDLAAKWTVLGALALAGLIALAILILVIRQLRKPYFPRNVEMVFMEGQAIFESDRKPLDHTKKEQKLSRYLDMAMAGRNGIPMDAVDLIVIKPMRTSTGSVRIKWRKPTGLVSLELDGGSVGRKYTEWAVDRELTLSSTSSNDRVRIVLTHGSEETFQTYQSSFDDSFASF